MSRIARFAPAAVISAILAAAGLAAIPARAAPPELRCGSAAVVLQSSDDMVIGGGIGPGRAKGQEGELRAAATVLELGASRLAIIACDILMVRRDILDAAARSIEEELRIPAAAILINATHTHHAPSTVTIHGYERDEGFCAQVRDAVVEAARRAAKRMDEGGAASARFRLGQEATVGENSRLLLSDGTIWWTGEAKDVVRPTGPFDPDLPVLGFVRADGRLESLIFNHSTHCIGTLEPALRSPGFYGLAAQRLERELGGTVTFVAGAFGSTHNRTLACAEMELRIVSAVQDAWKRSRPLPIDVLAGRRRELAYRVRAFDESKEDEAVVRYTTKRLGAGAPYVIDVFRKMRRELAPRQGEERKTWVQALRLGDVAWVGAPGELFTVLGIEIKRRSPFRYTYVAGVANDYIGYIPDSDAYDLGGYQVWTGYHSFVERGTGESIVAAAVELLEELHASR